jgi:hypothetical protein
MLADVILYAVGKMLVLLMNLRIKQQRPTPPPPQITMQLRRFVKDKSRTLVETLDTPVSDPRVTAQCG